jgi:phosphoglycolate phosphatase
VIRLVLFDIDGTLIRSGGAGMLAFARAFETEFKLPDATQGINFAGRTDTSIARQCFARHQIDCSPENFQRFFDAYLFWLKDFLPRLPGETCPGVRELIASFQALPSAPLIGLLTGNIRTGAELKLGHFQLWDQFEFGAFADDHEDRNQLACIASKRGSRILGQSLSGDEILVIGDTPLDIACAQSINARVLAVATGGHQLEELQACSPTWAIASLATCDVNTFCR